MARFAVVRGVRSLSEASRTVQVKVLIEKGVKEVFSQ